MGGQPRDRAGVAPVYPHPLPLTPEASTLNPDPTHPVVTVPVGKTVHKVVNLNPPGLFLSFVLHIVVHLLEGLTTV